MYNVCKYNNLVKNQQKPSFIGFKIDCFTSHFKIHLELKYQTSKKSVEECNFLCDTHKSVHNNSRHAIFSIGKYHYFNMATTALPLR